MPRKVTIYSYAVLPKPTAASLKIKKLLEAGYLQLRRVFVFADFGIAFRHCGLENAFSDVKPGSITICQELVQKLAGQGLVNAMSFIWFHEVGHTLLNLWGYPMADNEDAADEFATVYMLLANQPTAALEAAQWFASETPHTQKEEAIAKPWQDDRHTLSPQRARNIIRWLNQRDALLQRWQNLLVPNMQTTARTLLDKEKDRWIDHDLVRSELAKRQAAGK